MGTRDAAGEDEPAPARFSRLERWVCVPLGLLWLALLLLLAVPVMAFMTVLYYATRAIAAIPRPGRRRARRRREAGEPAA